MSIIERIRQQSPEKKFRLIWTIAGLTVIFLIIVWIISAHFGKQVPKDNTLMQTFEQGVSDVKNNFHK